MQLAQHLNGGQIEVGCGRKIADDKANRARRLQGEVRQNQFQHVLCIHVEQRSVRAEDEYTGDRLVLRMACDVAIKRGAGDAPEEGDMRSACPDQHDQHGDERGKQDAEQQHARERHDSRGEIGAADAQRARRSSRRSINPATAVSTTAASVPVGRLASGPIRNSRQKASVTEAKSSVSGVRDPAFSA